MAATDWLSQGTLVLASNNKGKIAEFEKLFAELQLPVEVVAQGKLNIEDAIEDGLSFVENAIIKARHASKISGKPAIADDSGLVIDVLGGLPGVHSARFAENDEKRIEKVLNTLQYEKYENRAAKFVCVMVIVSPEGETLHSCTGTCEGYIIDKPVGEHGFGYDPIFYIPELNATMAQLSMEEKNKISHRAKALRCMLDWLKSAN
ncbi:MAG TPA: non-canonical purine NTP pyrophosphatase, RdgB/HAM1 family [Acinetobacter lwoffii]|nr:non-canonical purine NTP pyrophosphatase, RdgB/HAM1 family [Acinetobacter lwoffii]